MSVVIREQYNVTVNSEKLTGKGKGKAVPLQAWTDPKGSRKSRFPDYVTTRDGGRLSALRTGRLYPTGNIPGTHFY